MAFVTFDSWEKTPIQAHCLPFKSLLRVTSHHVNRTSLTLWPAECVFSLVSPRHSLTERGHIAQITCVLKTTPSLLNQLWGYLSASALHTQKFLLTAKDLKHKTFYTQVLPPLLQKFTEKCVVLPAAPWCTGTFLVCRADSPALQTSLHRSPAFCRITESFSFSPWQLPCFVPALKSSLCFKSRPPSCSFKLQFSL